MTTNQQLLKKYWTTIAEEVNVKEIKLLWDDITVTKTYAPHWWKLSAQFGKDTGQIIGAAKQGNCEELSDWSLKVFQGDKEWILTSEQFEIRYSGLDDWHQTVEDGVIISLDLELTDDLKAEWVARELSRFLNQMRKDADFRVDQRVDCYWKTSDEKLTSVLEQFAEFLTQEALLASIQPWTDAWSITSECVLDEGTVIFTLQE